MERIFRAAKMIERVKAEGKGDMLDAKTLGFINKLDGKRGNDYNWRSVVRGEPLVYIEPDADQNGTYVNVADCE